MWVFGGGNNDDSSQKCNIDEANKHLAAVTLRIQELEKTVEEQRQELSEKDELASQCIKELNENHHSEVASLNSIIKDHLSTIRCLQGDIKRRDVELNILRQRVRMLDEIMRYKACLAKLTITLEQAEQYSRSVTGRGGNDPRLAGAVVNVFTEPAPRADTMSLPYIVDELPDEELIDRVGAAYVNGEREASVSKNTKPTLAEKAESASAKKGKTPL
uniref:Vimentin-related 1 n=1 Tax=Mesocestoides corti TaxID=53468 RepID=A0A5K3EMA5_MESCO